MTDTYGLVHYDLFAGIGGFSLAVDEVFGDLGVRHVFAEQDSFCRAVLRRHWPRGTFFRDVREMATDDNLGGNGQDQPTVVSGGFPCQPFSSSGSRRGTEDDRYLWPPMLDVVRRVRPHWVIAENVFGLVTWQQGMVLERVCLDLEGEGYEVRPLVVPAVGVGAPHRRDRTWIVAADPHAPRLGKQERAHDGVRLPGAVPVQEASARPDWGRPWQAVAASSCDGRLDDGLPREVDGVPYSYEQWRRASVHAYGNAIVPAVAIEIMRSVRTAWESHEIEGGT